MIAEIIPLVRLPRSLSYFDYEVPQNLEGQIKIGQLVAISFRGRSVRGVIIKIKEKQEQIKTILKPLQKILDFEPELDNQRLKLLWWMSDYYSVSPALFLKNLVPEPPVRISVFKIKSKFRPISLGVSSKDIPKIQENLKNISASRRNTALFHYQNHKNKIAVYLKCAEKFISNGKSILILEPQITDINLILPYFLHLFLGKVVILHGEMSKTEYWQNWQTVKNGSAKIVIGTRSAVLAPIKSLGLIIVNSEEMPDFKQTDQNPYYDARTILFKLSDLVGARLILASQAPRVETYYQTQIKGYELLEEKVNQPGAAHFIDMNQEVKKKNFLSLSEELQKKITEALSQKKKAVLLLNRRGGSTLMVCRDCGYIFVCQNCRLPLVCHEKECGTLSKFLCHRCGRAESIKLNCPKCHSVEIKFLGTGTQRVEREVKKIFPKIKVVRIDKDAEIKNYLPEADIFIGTQFFIKNFLPHLKNVGVIGIISADVLVSMPNFRSGERTFEWLTKLINFGQQSKSYVLVQTFSPNNFFVQAAVSQNYKSFYDKEIEERKNFGYPPFLKLARLIFRHSNEKKCFFEFHKLFKKLTSEWGRKVEIMADEKPREDKKKFIATIVVKFNPRLTTEIKKYFKTISGDWAIDMDPESLL